MPQRPSVLITLTLGLALGPAIALGLARFAYALILPAMSDDLDWSYAQAGGMNAANAVGYLVGALAAAGTVVRFGARRALIGALIVTTAALCLTGVTGAYALLVVVRVITGIGSGIGLVAGGVVVSGLGETVVPPAEAPSRRLLPLVGLYYAGAGIGILVSALVLPVVLGDAVTDRWRVTWVVTGALALVATLVVAGVARRVPAEPPELRRSPDSRVDWRSAGLVPALVAYLLFGLGYIAYMTFVVDLLRDRGTGTGGVTLFWSVLGIAAALSGLAWQRALTGSHETRTFVALLVLLAVGGALPLLVDAYGVALVSAVFFGLTFLMVPAMTTVLVQRHLPTSARSAGIATFTAVFAVGQILGPILTGLVTDATGDLRSGLAWSAAILVAAAAVSLLHRPGQRSSAS